MQYTLHIRTYTHIQTSTHKRMCMHTNTHPHSMYTQDVHIHKNIYTRMYLHPTRTHIHVHLILLPSSVKKLASIPVANAFSTFLNALVAINSTNFF